MGQNISSVCYWDNLGRDLAVLIIEIIVAEK